MNESNTKKVILVVGARPNFMKIAPIWKEMKKFRKKFQLIILHTGQHYDKNMSDLFFRDLELPKPDIYLGVGSGSQAVQTAKIMIELEKVLVKEKPDLIIAVGDVNSTLACSIVAAKLLISVAHIEAGLRSFDRTMPEEINRIVTDHLSTFLFTTCKDANENLKREGISEKKVLFVGNVMIDTLIKSKVKTQNSKILKKLGLNRGNYTVLTLHRPGNVDDRNTLQRIFGALEKISNYIPVIFPAHPRTLKKMRSFEININSKNVKLIEPLGYIDFLKLYMNSKFVMTDSGGIQEETTYLGIPCLTLRENTERPITVKEGTNVLVGTDKGKIIDESLKILDEKHKTGKIPKFWDGKTSQRIVKILREKL